MKRFPNPMNLLRIVWLCVFTGCFLGAQAARVDTLMVRSAAMNKDIQVVYILPDQALNGERCPVIYLLHGHGGNAKSWINSKPALRQSADEKGIIIVCPDGANSWYFDSPVNPSMKYETFVASELVDYTDQHYPTLADRNGRAITGLSMGGHGAMYLSIRHKDIFGAAGCMSGGVDIRPFPKNWHIKDWLGEYESNTEVWDAHTVINLVDGLENGELAITIDCGKGDFFYQVNQDLHKKLWEKGIEHDFMTRPGVHNWTYWNTSIEYQLIFFQHFFGKRKELFNGKDLTGWNGVVDKESRTPASKVFGVKDGNVRIAGKPFGYMRTTEKYKNYKLHAEWRWVKKGTNSGLFLHVQEGDGLWPTAIECQLGSGKAGDFVMLGGSKIAEVECSGEFPIKDRKGDYEKPVGEWNTVDVVCKGRTITVYINGKRQNACTTESLSEGFIALQSEGGPIEFRNVYVRDF